MKILLKHLLKKDFKIIIFLLKNIKEFFLYYILMSELSVESTLKIFDEKQTKEEDNNTNNNNFDMLQFITECDSSGVPYAWYDVRNKMMEKGVGALNDVFYYYQEHNHFFDPWINYLSACSHFDEEELNGKNNRQYRKQVEWKVKQLMKKQSEQPNKHMYQIMRENA
jgi:hypothetical protein